MALIPTFLSHPDHVKQQDVAKTSGSVVTESLFHNHGLNKFRFIELLNSLFYYKSDKYKYYLSSFKVAKARVHPMYSMHQQSSHNSTWNMCKNRYVSIKMPVRYIGFIDLGFMTYKFKEKCLTKVVMILVKCFLL